ncbi:MAG: SRPBCC domain-containing protein [Gemmatimonas sp.]
MSAEPPLTPQFEYAIYIAAASETVWTALTVGAFTRQFFFGRSVESKWTVGSPFVLRMADGRVDSEGEVLEASPPRVLSLSWRVVWLDDFKDLPAGRVTYRIDPVGDAVRLQVQTFQPDPADPRLLEGARNGWPLILSSLKSLLETGKPLRVSIPEPPAA